MEDLEIKTLADAIYEIVVGIQKARQLVEDGKEIPCARKLQGIEFKSRQLLEYLNIKLKEDSNAIMADQSIQECDPKS